MVPELLSSNLCSLRCSVDRYAAVVDCLFRFAQCWVRVSGGAGPTLRVLILEDVNGKSQGWVQQPHPQ